MIKRIICIGVFVTLLQSCSTYTPLVDTKGRSKFDLSNASEISNDLILCEKLADNNTTFFSNMNFWILSPRAESQYTDIYRKCMTGRNHQVLN